jgi:acyl carrier protein
MSIEERLRTFIVENIRDGWVPEAVTDDLPLIERGVIDSLGVFQLLAVLEEEFGVEVADDELVMEHFGTVRAIANLVRSKQAVR